MNQINEQSHQGEQGDRDATILIIDDDPGIHRVLTLLLQSEPEVSLHPAFSGKEGLQKAEAISPDLILLDLNMPQMNGMEALKSLMQTDKVQKGNIPIVIFTAYGSVHSAVQAIKLGAADYIEKPFDNQKLKQTIGKLIRERISFGELSSRQDIIGESPQIKKVWQLVEKYGPTDLPILLFGETGTGKELFAKAIHEISKRKNEPFVPLDCSTIPESLIESEMFGYERGAFTGAERSKPGRFAWADKGTLFLDELSALSLSYQPKLLRVIQERQFVALGSKKLKTIDVRFISSSNIDLREAIKGGTFREDLYYRITCVCIELPPLRERNGDIELLTRHFIDKYARKFNRPGLEISAEAMELLRSYPWPGNVRELEYIISAIVVLADEVILPQHLPPNLQSRQGRQGEIPPTQGEIFVFNSNSNSNGRGKIRLELNFECDLSQSIDLKQFKERIAAAGERLIISEVKKRFAFNQTELARFLAIDSKTLRSKVRAKSEKERKEARPNDPSNR